MSTRATMVRGGVATLVTAWSVGLVFASTVAVAQAPPAPAKESSGPNTSMVRWVEGEYAYRALKDGADRGWERFRLTVHPDGTRSMLMWHGLRARSAQFTVSLRAEGSFRPLEAYVSYWNDGKYRGSAAMFVHGPRLELVSHGTWGTHRETVDAPARFSIGSHPVSADGWHAWVSDATPGTPARLYSLEAGTDVFKPIRGTFRDMPMERVGPERIRVPAGEFDTVRYRMAGMADVWVHGEDRLLIRMRQERADRDYVLTKLTTGR
jgi:hypothetical protein